MRAKEFIQIVEDRLNELAPSPGYEGGSDNFYQALSSGMERIGFHDITDSSLDNRKIYVHKKDSIYYVVRVIDIIVTDSEEWVSVQLKTTHGANIKEIASILFWWGATGIRFRKDFSSIPNILDEVKEMVDTSQDMAEGQGKPLSKTKALNALRKELMNSYEYMKCGNLEEFKQRLQWLSEGMLKNHMTNGASYVINTEEIELYKEYRKKRDQIRQASTSPGVAEGSIKDAEAKIRAHDQRKADREQAGDPYVAHEIHSHNVIRKQLLDKRKRAQAAYHKKMDSEGVAEEQCPECGGTMVHESLINEKKDACYYKVKSRYKVWPSAYASGALVKCRKKGAKNWGTKSESIEQELEEDLHKWFKEKWVRFGPDGKIRGDCARGKSSEGKPKCLPQSKAQALGKKGRASAAARKRRQDPNPSRSGKAINVKTKKY